MLDYDGRWSPDLFAVAMTAAIEQEIRDLQTARVVIGSCLAALFTKDVAKKLDRQIARTTSSVRRMKYASRGIEPGEDEGLEDREDTAGQFVRIFQKMGVVKK
ncbi:MAG: hypothetical protein LN413_00345 [Candidatus Thermoplasmatota archaeon]|nr:hypothetical protein [Candidatus Thermoplasmatota archaeon]